MFRKILFALALLAVLPAQAATAYIEEFVSSGSIVWQAAKMPSVTHQTVAITSGSVQSAAFSGSTGLIRVECDAVCSVQIGTSNPTATATSMRLAAGVPEYFLVTAGDKLAVITNN